MLQQIRGYRDAYALRRDIGGELEFPVITLWDSLQAVREFASTDHEVATSLAADAAELTGECDWVAASNHEQLEAEWSAVRSRRAPVAHWIEQRVARLSGFSWRCSAWVWRTVSAIWQFLAARGSRVREWCRRTEVGVLPRRRRAARPPAAVFRACFAEAKAVNAESPWRHYAYRAGNPHPNLTGIDHLRALLADQRHEEPVLASVTQA